MREFIQNNRMIIGAFVVLGVIGAGFAGVQTDILSAAYEQPQSQSDRSAEPGQAMQAQENLGEDSAQSGDATEPGQAMQAQEDLGEESNSSEDSMNSGDSMNDTMMENDSMEQ